MLATLQSVGKDVSECTSIEEALVKWGLDWEVELRPMFFESKLQEGELLAAGTTRAIVRTDTETMLGRVGGDYHPMSNVPALKHVDHLIASGQATLDAIFSVQGGRRVGASLKLNEKIFIANDDPMDLYITVTTAHDGGHSTTTDVTPIRLWCTNQLAISHRTAKRSWPVRHLSSMPEQLKETEEELKRVLKYAEWLKETGDKLAEKEISRDQLVRILQRTVKFVASERARDAFVTDVTGLIDHSPLIGHEYRHSAWGALNAVTEWIDHRRNYRNDESRFLTITHGFGNRVRNIAAQELISA